MRGCKRVRLRLTRKEATDRQQERQLRAINSACGSVRSRYCSNLARFRSDTRYRVLWCARDAATRKSRSTVWRNRNVGKFANEHWRLCDITKRQLLKPKGSSSRVVNVFETSLGKVTLYAWQLKTSGLIIETSLITHLVGGARLPHSR